MLGIIYSLGLSNEFTPHGLNQVLVVQLYSPKRDPGGKAINHQEPEAETYRKKTSFVNLNF